MGVDQIVRYSAWLSADQTNSTRAPRRHPGATIPGMYAFVDFVLVAVLVISMIHFFLPRHPRLHEERGQLALRPPLPRLLGESTGVLVLLLGVVYLLFFLASIRLLLGVVIAALVLLRLSWLLWRRWRTARIVFDRRADFIRQGRVQIGRASEATVVHVTGESAPALALFIRHGGGDSSPWPVPGVDGAHAEGVGRAIADYLGVPLVSRVQ